jgi:hypothetical protein
MTRSAIALFSGGLDSMLAIRMMQVQGIQVRALHFVSPFFGSPLDPEAGKYNARRAADSLGVPLSVITLGNDYLEMLRQPRHGYGKAVNPCVDCHTWFFRVARGLMAEHGASFAVSGEVLGQRPMSQRRDNLLVVERESGLEGLLLRPLSARLLPPTIPEREGWVDREQLGAIQGRSRKEQMRLAKELGLPEYPTPAGGCLLTELSYAPKVRDIFTHTEQLQPRDFQLLRVGRHFRLGPRTKVVISRNEAENLLLEGAVKPGEATFHWLEGGSPVGLVTGELHEKLLETAAKLLLRYTKAEPGRECTVQLTVNGDERTFPVVNDCTEALVDKFRV